jgi:hypothetical protein
VGAGVGDVGATVVGDEVVGAMVGAEVGANVGDKVSAAVGASVGAKVVGARVVTTNTAGCNSKVAILFTL